MQSTTEIPAPPPSEPGPRRLTRASQDRMIGGVCGGIGRYFGVDPTLVRIGFVALVLLGGTGLVVYAAALLLVPLDDEGKAAASTPRDRTAAIGLLALFLIVCVVLGGFGLAGGGALVPIAFLALAGLAVWWLVSGERPSGSPGTIVRRAALGVGLLIGCGALAVGSFFASGLGGAVVVAGLVIAVGAALVAAAFVGGARWLILPAIAIALPLAFVSAAGIDLDGGFGERREHPTTLAELPDRYRLGAGELVIDLRDLELPPGDHPLSVDVGAGHALVLVRDDVCVASKASIGIGAVSVFERDSGGIDMEWNDARRAPAGTARLVIDSDLGLGLLTIRHREDGTHSIGPRWEDSRGYRGNRASDESNAACSSSAT